MMKLLIMTGPLYPRVGNNANLLSKLFPFLKEKHEVMLLSPAFGASEIELPETVFGCPIRWVTDHGQGWKRKLLYPAASKLKHDPGLEGEIGAKLIEEAAAELRKSFSYDAVLCTMQPYPATLAVSRMSGVPKIAYLMDPPDFVFDSLPWRTGQKQLPVALEKLDAIFTTPFIRQAIRNTGREALWEKCVPVSFPHMEENEIVPTEQDVPMDPEKIHLLFCGALFPDVRSPDCFLEIVKRLDERFCVTFMGRNCEQFWKEYTVETRAQVRALPPQPYQVAVNAMEKADILINLGNNMLIHMPSKTLDYINTGKPIVNFHKFTDCPTLYYTERYPLSLNLYEKAFDPVRDTARFVEFCLKNREQRVSREEIEKTYNDCRPETIAAVLLERLGKL